MSLVNSDECHQVLFADLRHGRPHLRDRGWWYHAHNFSEVWNSWHWHLMRILNVHFDWASFLTAMTPYTFSRTPNNGSVLPWCVLKHYVLSKRDRSSFVYYSTSAVHPVLSTASRVLKKGLAARSCNNQEFCRRRAYLEDGLELDGKWFGMSSWMIFAT